MNARLTSGITRLLRVPEHRRLTLRAAILRRLQRCPKTMLITVAIALPVVWATYDGMLARFCYDYPFTLGNPPAADTNEQMAIINVTDTTFQIPGFERGSDGGLDRSVWVRLLQFLRPLDPQLIFLDLVFSKAGVPEIDAQLGAEVRANPNVIVGAAFSEKRTNLVVGRQSRRRVKEETVLDAILPAASLNVPENQYGFMTFRPLDRDQTVRRLRLAIKFDEKARNLPRSAETAVGRALAIVGNGAPSPEDTTWTTAWLNYIGPSGALCPKYSLQEVLAEPEKFKKLLRQRLIFVGSESTLGIIGSRADLFGNPWTAVGRELMPGVELHATTLDNILRNEWLTRPSEFGELILCTLWTITVVFLLSMLRPKFVILAGLSLMLLSAILGILAHRWAHIWFNWLAIWEIPTLLAAMGAVWNNRNELGWPLVFISYRRSGGALAHAFRADLERAGKSAWMDDQIEAEDFPIRLRLEIQDAPFFLLLLTGDAVEKLFNPNDWMRKEIKIAFESRRRIIILDAMTGSSLEQSDTPDGPEFRILREQNNFKYSHENHSHVVTRVLKELSRNK